MISIFCVYRLYYYLFRLWSSYSIKDPTFTLEAAQTLCERGVVSVQSGYQFSADNRHKRAVTHSNNLFIII